MLGKKKYLSKHSILPVLIIAIFLGLGIAYFRGDIGITEQAMLKENADYVQDGYAVTRKIGDSMAVFLQYNRDQTECDVDIYVKRKGSIGWFFRYGGASASVSGPIDYVHRLQVEENDQYALVIVSPRIVDRVEIVMSDNARKTITWEPGEPFAYIMEQNWEVTIYGADGQRIEPVERNV